MKLLRQLITGRIYAWTKILAARKDMTEYDPDIAKKRLEAAKKRLEELEDAPVIPSVDKKALDESAELAEVENKIKETETKQAAKSAGAKEKEKPKTPEQIEAERRQEIIDKDPDIIKIKAMVDKKDVEDYVLQEFGEDIDRRHDLDDLKDRAIHLRTERLFEA